MKQMKQLWLLFHPLDSNGCASIEDEKNKMGGEFISVYGYNWDSTFLKVGSI